LVIRLGIRRIGHDGERVDIRGCFRLIIAGNGDAAICERRGFRGRGRSGGEGTINSQIVKEEGEYTPRVSDTVTHVLLRTHRRRRRRSLLEILSRNESNENDHKTLRFTTPRA